MADAFVGLLALALLKAIRLIDPDVVANLVGGLLRRIGPWLPEHRIGRDNLKAAFPEKSDAEIEEFCAVCGTTSVASAPSLPTSIGFGTMASRLAARPDHGFDGDLRTALHALSSGKPTLCFSAHLANWELPAVACRRYGIDASLIYRRPSLPFLSDAVIKMRENCMPTLIQTGLSAPVQLAAALERGSNVGMLVDQFFDRGVPVIVLRPARAGQSADRPPRPPRRVLDLRAARYSSLTATASRSRLRDRLSPLATPRAGSTCRARCRRSPAWSRAGCASTPSNGSGCTGAGGTTEARGHCRPADLDPALPPVDQPLHTLVAPCARFRLRGCA